MLRRATSPPPRLSRWSWVSDVALALVLTVCTVDSALNRIDGAESLTSPTLPTTPAGLPSAPAAPIGTVLHHYGAVHPWQIALAVLAALPLMARRKYPLAVFWTVLAAGALFHLSPGFDALFTFVASVIAAYSAAIYSPYRALALGGTLAGTALLAVTHTSSVPALSPGTATFLFLIPVGLVANASHTWSQRVRLLEQEKEAAGQRAAEQERARIARELHDVITHHVSVMVVQAGAARKIMKMDRAEAEIALMAVETSGRTAMTELRHAMDLLTMGADENHSDRDGDLRPAPGLRQLPALADRLRAAGVAVELGVVGEAVQLPPGMDLAAYRVVQEAVTNAVKHAQGAKVRIAVDHGSEALILEVTDTGGIPATTAHTGGGRGLFGLRERLGVYGGSLTAERIPTGGFQVRAVIPREPAGC